MSGFNVHQKKSIPVSTDCCTSAIYNAVVEDVTKEGRWIERVCIATLFEEGGDFSKIPDRVPPEFWKCNVRLCQMFGCNDLLDVVEAYTLLEQFCAVRFHFGFGRTGAINGPDQGDGIGRNTVSHVRNDGGRGVEGSI